ncbi:hypothetical protein K6U06_10905 [Acidiferrimicrobium sp. IK]|uniref:hypothetical protein n=1 Tax=Acidiferrimicrobium sp. IK TaxID=2871700 RepID=UPI0021CB4E87|nr:hypothetical protein [Acidiferrimicrobium sp. IK]MCU4184869.1 hypothetical protein [Acidiferrimicrobium sp. IK]
MKLSICTICEAATLHDGLLNLLGAGITRVGRTGFPSPLGLQVAAMATVVPADVPQLQSFSLDVTCLLDGESIGNFRLRGEPEPPSDGWDGQTAVMLPLVVPLPFILQRAGSYELKVTFATQTDVAEEDVMVIPLSVVLAPTSAAPASG